MDSINIKNNDFDQLMYWMALKSIAGIGNSAFPLLMEKFGSLPAAFSCSAHELSMSGIGKKNAASIAGFKDWDKIRRMMELTHKENIKIVTYLDDLYPARLAEIYDHPALLYILGNLTKEDINLAIIGSRAATPYGRYTTERISRELALQGITIISGMARGIDSAAHRGALAAHGRTIAVLGSGLDVIYPPENKKLFSEIVQCGAVISEYPLGTQPFAYNFPSRNRIISGMSYGVVVVEAGEKSGSLITARLAIEQGREVFAVPGAIDSAHARGTNSLIKQGAKLVENIGDILEDILPQLDKQPIGQMPSRNKSTSASGTDQIAATKKEKISKLDQLLIDSISQETLHADDIIIATGLLPADVLSALITLELKGIVQQHPGKYFSLKK